MSPQQLQPGVACHQPCQCILSTAGHRAHQLLGDLEAQSGGWVGGWGAGCAGGEQGRRLGGWLGAACCPRLTSMTGACAAPRGHGVLSTVTALQLPHSLQTQVQTLFGSEGGQGPGSLDGVGRVPPGLGAAHIRGHCWDGGAQPHTRGAVLRWGGTVPHTGRCWDGGPPGSAPP